MTGAPDACPGAAARAMGVVAGLLALLLAAPPPHTAVVVLAGAGSSDDPTAPLVAAVALAAWVVSGWLTLTVALVALSGLPGLLGRAGRAVAARVAPAAVRRAVETALGITVALGVMTPTASSAAPGPDPAVRAVAATEVAVDWDLDWPSVVAGAAGAGPAPVAPTAPTAVAPRSPAPTPAPTEARATEALLPPSPAPSPASTSVVVQPGDSLWSLAERSLRRTGTVPTDHQVAQAWPRWWSANRAVIGDDPDLLLPGTRLRPPPADTA